MLLLLLQFLCVSVFVLIPPSHICGSPSSGQTLSRILLPSYRRLPPPPCQSPGILLSPGVRSSLPPCRPLVHRRNTIGLHGYSRIINNEYKYFSSFQMFIWSVHFKNYSFEVLTRLELLKNNCNSCSDSFNVSILKVE